jgi:hypothetical protein
MRQMKWIKEGMDLIIFPSIVDFVSWQDIEKRACG